MTNSLRFLYNSFLQSNININLIDINIFSSNVGLNFGRFLAAYYLNFPLLVPSEENEVQDLPDIRNWPKNVIPESTLFICDRGLISKNLSREFSPKFPALIFGYYEQCQELLFYLENFSDFRSTLLSWSILHFEEMIPYGSFETFLNENTRKTFQKMVENLITFEDGFKIIENISSISASVIQLDVLFETCHLRKNIEELLLNLLFNLLEKMPIFVPEDVSLPRRPVYVFPEPQGDIGAQENVDFLKVSVIMQILFTLLSTSNSLRSQVMEMSGKMLKEARGFCLTDLQFDLVSRVLMKFLNSSESDEDSEILQVQNGVTFEKLAECFVRVQLRDEVSLIYRQIAEESETLQESQEILTKKLNLSLPLYKHFFERKDISACSSTSEDSLDSSDDPLLGFLSSSSSEQLDAFLTFLHYCMEKYRDVTPLNLPMLSEETRHVWINNILYDISQVLNSEFSQEVILIKGNHDKVQHMNLTIEQQTILNFLSEKIVPNGFGNSNGIQLKLNLKPAELYGVLGQFELVENQSDRIEEHQSKDVRINFESQLSRLSFTSVEESDVPFETTSESNPAHLLNSSMDLSTKIQKHIDLFFDLPEKHTELVFPNPLMIYPEPVVQDFNIPKLNVKLARSSEESTSEIQSIPYEEPPVVNVSKKKHKRKKKHNHKQSRPTMELLNFSSMNGASHPLIPFPLLTMPDFRSDLEYKPATKTMLETETQTVSEEPLPVVVLRDVGIETQITEQKSVMTETEPEEKPKLASFFHVQDLHLLEKQEIPQQPRFLHIHG